MKRLLFTALVAASPLAMADISLGSPAPSNAEAPASTEAQPYLDMAQEVLSAVRNLTTVLETVQDTASADAAAAQIRTLTASMQELQARAEAMPRPSAAVEQQVRSRINVQEVQQLVSSFMSSFIRIGMNNAYGSQALLDSLGPVMNTMPGQGM